MLDRLGVTTVLLDMDGTLLDLHFDNHFWRVHVPRRYAAVNGMTELAAREQLDIRYAACAGTLAWYSVRHWQAELGLDIMALKREVQHLIAVRPDVHEFLSWARSGQRRLMLVTNAHGESLRLKMEVSGLAPYFDALITSHELGHAKEDVRFWSALQQRVGFDAGNVLLVDDSLPVLDAARRFGIGHLFSVCSPDSHKPPQPTGSYQAISSFADLMRS